MTILLGEYLEKHSNIKLNKIRKKINPDRKIKPILTDSF